MYINWLQAQRAISSSISSVTYTVCEGFKLDWIGLGHISITYTTQQGCQIGVWVAT